MKAVVASSRLGSASSSHSSIQESNKTSSEPSSTEDVTEDTAALGKKMQEGDQGAAEGTAAEMVTLQAEGQEKDAGGRNEELSRMVLQALEDGLKTGDPAMKRRSVEKLKTVGEEMDPKAEEEGPAAEAQDVILPEY